MAALRGAVAWFDRHRPKNVGRFVTPYLVAGMSILLILGLIRVDETNTFATELRDGLVTNCEQSGNPLRTAVQMMLREQIKQAESTPARYFPDVPPAVFHRLVREQVEATRAAIRRIAPVDCAALYPND